MVILSKYSMGVGDRFGRQGVAQVRAVKQLQSSGMTVAPVWNKSFREHGIVGSEPADTRREADAAVAAEGWIGSYFVDADHIGLKNVNAFIEASDFFTLDVADFIGQPAPDADVAAFVAKHKDLVGPQEIEGFAEPLTLTAESLAASARHYLGAVKAATALFRHIGARKGAGNFVTEVSMDETLTPQTPADLLVILAALADQRVAVQTLAPKFTGRFNKGVDYVGDVAVFAREFDEDVWVLRHAATRFNLPPRLKLSVHSGSDKFALYPHMAASLARAGAGVHLKTAGTTWLEELAGLAEGGGEGLAVAKEIYRQAAARREEMCAPYATVIDIDPACLPTLSTVEGWTSEQYVRAVQHVQADPLFNPHFRQFMHVSYRIAAELGIRFTAALGAHAERIGRRVTANLYERHLRPLFGALG